MVDYQGIENNAFVIVSLNGKNCDITGYARSKSASFDV